MSADAAATEPVAEIRVVQGDPTAEELAAITAVINGYVDELAASEATRAHRVITAWQRSQRRLRQPIRPAAGAWRSFSA